MVCRIYVSSIYLDLLHRTLSFIFILTLANLKIVPKFILE